MNAAISTEQNGQISKAPTPETTNTSLAAYVRVLAIGTFFGIVLVKSEVARWQRVHDMFLFKEAHMYLIIATGIMVSGAMMLVIRQFGVKTVEGQPIKYKSKPFHKGVVIGGMLFGAGWATTGACPGPIYAQIGAGAWMAPLHAGGRPGWYVCLCL